MVFGYLRVSTSEQNEARQLDEMIAMGIDPARLYLDKCSGKDFNRPAYKRLIRRLKKGRPGDDQEHRPAGEEL